MSFAWNWTARDRATGEVLRHYTTGPYADAASLRDHLDAHYRGLTDFQVEPADGPPKGVLRPVNPKHFQSGILDMVRRELGGRRADRSFADMARVKASLAGVPLLRPAGAPFPTHATAGRPIAALRPLSASHRPLTP